MFPTCLKRHNKKIAKASLKKNPEINEKLPKNRHLALSIERGKNAIANLIEKNTRPLILRMILVMLETTAWRALYKKIETKVL